MFHLMAKINSFLGLYLFGLFSLNLDCFFDSGCPDRTTARGERQSPPGDFRSSRSCCEFWSTLTHSYPQCNTMVYDVSASSSAPVRPCRRVGYPKPATGGHLKPANRGLNQDIDPDGDYLRQSEQCLERGKETAVIALGWSLRRMAPALKLCFGTLRQLLADFNCLGNCPQFSANASREDYAKIAVGRVGFLCNSLSTFCRRHFGTGASATACQQVVNSVWIRDNLAAVANAGSGTWRICH